MQMCAYTGKGVCLNTSLKMPEMCDLPGVFTFSFTDCKVLQVCHSFDQPKNESFPNETSVKRSALRHREWG